MILDIFVVIILLLSMFIGYKRGASKTVLSLLFSILAFVAATVLGDLLATEIYDRFISEAILSNVSGYASSADSLAVAPTVDSLPSFVQFIVNITGFESDSSFVDAVNSAKDTVAFTVESVLQPLVHSVLSFVITLVLFIIIKLIIRLFVLKPICSVFKLPVLRHLDSIAGMFIALLLGLLLITFLAFLLRLIAPTVENMPDILSQQTIYNSYIFKHFYNGNIFYALTSII